MTTTRPGQATRRALALMLLIGAAALLIAGGCNAKFTDTRPKTSTADTSDVQSGDTVLDQEAPTDISANDGESDGEQSDATVDTAPSDDVVSDQSGGSEKVIAEGTIVGTMYPAITGMAQLVKRADGAIVLRIKGLVMVDVPGPSIVLTSRTSPIGALDEQNGDILVAPLTKPFQSDYEWVLPNGDGGRRNVVAHCTPFGIDMGNGVLNDVP